MFDREPPETDRGQAYTLEGFIGAMVVLMAVLFALQSVVIMPTTGGLADRTVQAQVQQEVQDSLLVSTQDGNLSEVVRNWDGDGGFENTSSPADDDTYTVDEFANVSDLGTILYERFGENGWEYNVELHPENSSRQKLVYHGGPPDSALTASYTVTLYDEQNVTGDTADDTLEEAAKNGNETIPREYGNESPLYNVVEVRVIVW